MASHSSDGIAPVRLAKANSYTSWTRGLPLVGEGREEQRHCDMEWLIGVPCGHDDSVGREVLGFKVSPVEEIVGFFAAWAPCGHPENPLCDAIAGEVTDFAPCISPISSDEESATSRSRFFDNLSPKLIVLQRAPCGQAWNTGEIKVSFGVV